MPAHPPDHARDVLSEAGLRQCYAPRGRCCNSTADGRCTRHSSLSASFGGGQGLGVLNASLVAQCQPWCLHKPFNSGKTMKDRCRNPACRGCEACAKLLEGRAARLEHQLQRQRKALHAARAAQAAAEHAARSATAAADGALKAAFSAAAEAEARARASEERAKAVEESAAMSRFTTRRSGSERQRRRSPAHLRLSTSMEREYDGGSTSSSRDGGKSEQPVIVKY